MQQGGIWISCSVMRSCAATPSALVGTSRHIASQKCLLQWICSQLLSHLIVPLAANSAAVQSCQLALVAQLPHQHSWSQLDTLPSSNAY